MAFSRLVVGICAFVLLSSVNADTAAFIAVEDKAPGKPENLTVGEVTDSSISLSWMEPSERSGIIRGYRIYYMTNMHTDLKILKSASTMEYVLTNLEPYTEYKILVRAYTAKFDGDPSEKVVVKTDVRGPSPPRIANLSCHTEDTLILEFQRPATYYHSIDGYSIYYRNELSWEFEKVDIAVKNEHPEHRVLIPIPNSTVNTPIMFEVKVRGWTKSLLDPTKVYDGNFSESRKVPLAPGCDRLPVFLHGGTQGGQGGFLSEKELSAGIIATVVCASFAILLLILALVLWRKYFQAAYYYLDDPSGTPPTNGATPWDGGGGVAVIDNKGEEALGLEGALGYKGPIPKLQQLFIELVLKQEQEEYNREGIKWENIQYFNNQIICELVEQPHKGILAIMDEACLNVGKVTDEMLLEAMNQKLANHQHYTSRKLSPMDKAFKQGEAFRIKHYAGDVVYDIRGFMEKNKDTLFQDFKRLLYSSSDETIRSMWPEGAQDIHKTTKRPLTAGTLFKNSMVALVKNLTSKEPFYVRCLKPNEQKSPVLFDEERVRHQVNYLGLIENVRVRRAGFAYRQTYERLLRR